MNKLFRFFLKCVALCLVLALFSTQILAFAGAKKKEHSKSDTLNGSFFQPFKFRSIGPAYTGGRIADFAVNPSRKSEYYVAVAAGNVWKTENSGTTWKPVFDTYGSWSIADVEIDPTNHHVVWIGTGEYNSQRAIGYGDGVYKSEDGGKSFKNKGLKLSEHIGRVVIDPRNGNVVWVAAQGPLWGPGGERGLYKTTDGGENWVKVLEISENTGVTDVVLDPRNPDVVYAASYQRRRHVYTLIDGGPESAIYKSVDGGANWVKLKKGLPGGDVGRIGLAISPVNPDIVYAIVEAAEGEGGTFRTTDRGASWKKMSDHVAGSPQYYNRLFCDPKDADKIYSMDTYAKRSDDGGATWKNMSYRDRHVDDHALWIDPDNTSHLLIGGDGGVYESFDDGKYWDFKENLPITQLYRVSVDQSLPFYYVFGGTQDNNSMGGPSRTTVSDGVRNEDWFVTQGGDGFETQVDPQDPNLIFAQAQHGDLVRYDKRSGEQISVQPQPPAGEAYRWNWNSPLMVSAHHPHRLYFAANKLFYSDDRGDSWSVISPDLTRQLDRNKLPVFGKIQSPEAVAKNASTSFYGNIVALHESPLKAGLLYVGTDDGLIQVTENDGQSWTKYDQFPGVPETTYVSYIFASHHSESVVYASFDGRKQNNLRPMILKSTDKGKTWQPIVNGLPDRGTVYCLAEDHLKPGLLFAGTEFGVYISTNDGASWIKFSNGLPTTAVMDMEIQKRENDLVIATFGRGFYILDNYAAIREITPDLAKENARLFPVSDAVYYKQSGGKYGQGATYFGTENPPVAAAFYYWVKEAPKSLKQIRKEAEGKAAEQKIDIEYPTMDQLKTEDNQEPSYLLFTIKDEDGTVVRTLKRDVSQGMGRINWDLRYPGVYPVTEAGEPFATGGSGMPVAPGKYEVSLSLFSQGNLEMISGPVSFHVKSLDNSTLPASDRRALAAFQKKVAALGRVVMGAEELANDLNKRIKAIRTAMAATPAAPFTLDRKARQIEEAVQRILVVFNGDESLSKRNENQPPTVSQRLGSLVWGHWNSTSAPTKTMLNDYDIILKEFNPVYDQLKSLWNNDVKAVETELEQLGAPYTPGRFPELKL